MKRLFLAALLAIVLAAPVWSAAVPVQFLLTSFLDNDAAQMANGKVYAYSAGTVTPTSLYLDSAKSQTAPWPVVLDTYGRANVYGDGQYKFVIKTADDVTIATYDNVELLSSIAPATLVVTSLTAASQTVNLLYMKAGTIASASISGSRLINSALSNCTLIASPTLPANVIDLQTAMSLDAVIASSVASLTAYTLRVASDAGVR